MNYRDEMIKALNESLVCLEEAASFEAGHLCPGDDLDDPLWDEAFLAFLKDARYLIEQELTKHKAAVYDEAVAAAKKARATHARIEKEHAEGTLDLNAEFDRIAADSGWRP